MTNSRTAHGVQQASGSALPPWPVEHIPGSLASGVLILCDHASNTVPPDLDDLGLPRTQFERHIAYDIGAAAVTRALARDLGAPAILTRFSRLVIDPNRGRDDPTLVMQVSDGAVVPGNRGLSNEAIKGRIARFYDPYDAAITLSVRNAMAAGHPPVIVTIHSFTPVWRGWVRPWHAGILWDADPRFAKPLLAGLAAEEGLVVGDNEPYDGALAGDTIDRHATRLGLANALIEIRQDLIGKAAGAEAWAARFARLLAPLALRADLRRPTIHPTRTRDRLRRH
ncbi:N-formylglutamate amidohydrolase [Microvirga antarctica]|uniref:N-formylglutamate amidohydrolase n=1 Tax=Microvirga antarctica TaxID=2819233 RepID=UPI001B318520|nr:N-formylglutamate amidohydrolase [Microvirga antarctica]